MYHCGTSPLDDHLDHCFVVLQHITRKLLDTKTGRLREHNQCYSARWSFLEIFDLWSLTTERSGLSEVWIMFPKTETIRSHRSKTRLPSNLNPTSKERILMNCVKMKFVSYTSNLSEQMTSKNAQCSSRSGFWILKISRKIGDLKQSQSALFCSITHIAKLFVLTCMMNVWNQSIQTFVPSFGPLCDGLSKFIHWP